MKKQFFASITFALALLTGAASATTLTTVQIDEEKRFAVREHGDWVETTRI